MNHRFFALCVFMIAFLVIRTASTQNEEAAKVVPDGNMLFQQFCVVCHGPMLQGSPLGPALTTAAAMGKSDRDIYREIAEGSFQNGMPAFGRGLAREEIMSLVGYLRTVQQRTTSKRGIENKPNPIPTGGDAKKGESLFKGKAGCFDCHSVFYTGGTVGPDLNRVAERLAPAEIYEAVATPSKKVLRDFQAKSLVSAEGKTIIGRFRNETPETIQILDKTGALWTTYWKKNFSQIAPMKTSLMPENLLEKLSPDEAKDLFAFLNDLK